MSEGQNIPDATSPSETQTNSLKRKRQLLPLGTPPPQLPALLNPPEQRTALRVNRACNTCRRQKMRCDGPDKGTACSRCQHASIECVFEKVPPNKPPVIPATSRLTTLEAKLEMLQATQAQMQHTLQEILAEIRRPGSTSTVSQGSSSGFQDNKLPRSPTVTNSGSPRLPSVFLNPHFIPSPAQSLISPCHTPSDNSSNPPGDPQSSGDSKLSEHARSQQIWEERNSVSYPPGHDAAHRKSSVSEPLDKVDVLDECQEPVFKRPRLNARQVLREEGCRSWNPDDPIKDFRTEDLAYPDPVQRGLLSEQEARDLFKLFFDLCHPRMPIFDVKMDTFDSIRLRSVLCFCCILMVATKSRDGGNSPSELQSALWEEAFMRAKQTMFQRVTDLEVIQSLILLSAWSESTGGTCWIVLGHAIRCGVETGIQKALSRLASGNAVQDEEKVRVLVVSARIWCALFAFEYQLSFGIGRHTMTGHPRTIRNARKILLNHPFSQPLDMRLLFATEILVMEYEILESLPSTDPTDSRLVAHLQEAREKIDAWEREWLALLSDLRHVPESYMIQCLYIFKYYGLMTVHMAGIPNVLTAGHLDAVSEEERQSCYHAISAAKEILRISTEMESYRDGLRYSPTCFYGGVSFVGTLILRFGAVLQEDGGGLERAAVKLYHVLQGVPTDRFKHSFQNILREKKLIL